MTYSQEHEEDIKKNAAFLTALAVWLPWTVDVMQHNMKYNASWSIFMNSSENDSTFFSICISKN